MPDYLYNALDSVHLDQVANLVGFDNHLAEQNRDRSVYSGNAYNYAFDLRNWLHALLCEESVEKAMSPYEWFNQLPEEVQQWLTKCDDGDTWKIISERAYSDHR